MAVDKCDGAVGREINAMEVNRASNVRYFDYASDVL
jgi:hypothetical protein